MQRGFVQFIILGVVVLAVVAAGTFYLGRSTTPKPSPAPASTSQTPAANVPQPTPVPDETANWKTYTNTKNGFTFKYPETEYTLDDFPEDNSMGIDYCPDKLTRSSGNCNFNTGSDEIGGFSVSVTDNPQRIPLETWLQSSPRSGLSYGNGCILRDSRTVRNQQSFLGFEALEVEHPSDPQMWQETCKGQNVFALSGSYKDIFINKGGKVFNLSIHVRKDNSAGGKVTQELDQILSSFKFL